MDEVGTACMQNILTIGQTSPMIFPMGEYGTGFDPNNLPTWMREDDLAYYVSKFEKTYFNRGLNYYRNLNQ